MRLLEKINKPIIILITMSFQIRPPEGKEEYKQVINLIIDEIYDDPR